jgi:hypothetical protein
MPNLKLVRKADYLLCDRFVWEDTLRLASAFGSRSKSSWLMKLSNVGARVEVSDEDAHSIAQAIQDCFDKLKSGRRPTRRQIAHLMLMEER